MTTTVSQTYTPTLNVSVTVKDGVLIGVTRWVSGDAASETQRDGSVEYVRTRSLPKSVPTPGPNSTPEELAAWGAQDEQVVDFMKAGRRIYAAVRLRRVSGANLRNAKEATELPVLWSLFMPNKTYAEWYRGL